MNFNNSNMVHYCNHIRTHYGGFVFNYKTISMVALNIITNFF